MAVGRLPRRAGMPLLNLVKDLPASIALSVVVQFAKSLTTEGTLRLRSGQAPAHEGDTQVSSFVILSVLRG